MFVEVLLNALWQVIIFIGCVYLVGFIISLINRVFYKITGYSRLVIYGTGFIGTPIHETGHLLMCLVFFHKINEVKFFQINDEDGVLGYVSHSWNPKNIYQQIGNYFIGVAPIVVGTLIIFFGMKYFLPATYGEINAYFTELSILNGSVSVFEYVFQMIADMMTVMFAEISIGWQWWVFMLLSLCIALHMNLSGADIKGSLVAIPLLVVILLAINLIIGLIFKGFYGDYLAVMNNAGSFLICTLALSLVFSAMCLALAGVIKTIVWGIGKAIKRK